MLRRRRCLSYPATTPLPQDQFPAPDKDSANVLTFNGLEVHEFVIHSLRWSNPLTAEQGGHYLSFCGRQIANATEYVQATVSHLKDLPKSLWDCHIRKLWLNPTFYNFYLQQNISRFPLMYLRVLRPFSQGRNSQVSIYTNLAFASSSLFAPPSIDSVGSKEEHEKLFHESESVDLDLTFMLFAKPESVNQNYKKAVLKVGSKSERSSLSRT
ncbi:hypothetical protein DL96DRAFT_1722443 [Flagelloscypha sp. PMI_526]|nr:hypothetical protein DL96DRAFT_1722443 [Flagelloscypha sp. PMI_526]